MAKNSEQIVKPHRAVIKLASEMKGNRHSPVVRVISSDGRMSEFKDSGLVIPEVPDDEASSQVLALLVNGKGEILVTPDGNPAVVDIPILSLRVEDNPNKLLTWKQVAEVAGVHVSSVKRAVKAKELEKVKVGGAHPRFKLGDVSDWIAGKRKAANSNS